MNKIRSFFLLAVLSGSSIYLGAVFHARLFSIGDGLSRINLKKDSMPEGFEIYPSRAFFIHGTILGNAWHWGATSVVDAYVDNEAYYILGAGDLPPSQPFCSYTARMFGTVINGKDGTILEPVFGKWENKGYIHLSKDEITEIIQNGMDISEVYDLLGQPFLAGGGDYVDEDGNPFDAFHYWCKDGEVVIFANESKVNLVTGGTLGLRV